MAMIDPPNWTSAAARRVVAAAGGAVSVESAIRLIVRDALVGIDRRPTDLDQVARRFGVTAIKAELLPVAGELRRSEAGFEVVYASNTPRGRRRFTIAHELGHAFFEQTGPNCPRRGVELERICDLFASELLMPHDDISVIVQTGAAQELLAIVDQCHVSWTAAMIRFVRYSYLQAAVDTLADRATSFRALARGERDIDELVDKARANGESTAIFPLRHNRVWNGPWRVRAAADERGHVVVVTAEELEPDASAARRPVARDEEKASR